MTPTCRTAYSPMARLIAQLVQWIARKLGLLIVIVAILVVASVLRSEWQAHREAQAALGQLAAGRIAGFQRELDAIDANIDAFETQAQASRGEYLDLAKQARAARRAAHRARARLDVLERNYWWWDDYVSPAKVAELRAARATYAALDRSATAAEKARAAKSNA